MNTGEFTEWAIREKQISFGYSAGCVGLADLANIPGSTGILAGWTVISDRALIQAIIGDVKAVSAEASKRYAEAAAKDIKSIGVEARFAVGITAAVRSNYEKRSPDEAYIAVYDLRGKELHYIIGHLPLVNGVFEADIERLIQNAAIKETTFEVIAELAEQSVPLRKDFEVLEWK